ncbi:type IV secretory system conjugative DNA transfer family protein [Paenibacillus macerans]|uniref:type IV secretory system conjugative DNA transfer family protein n=1 Tax=Paenibacillus macerans TaxID=44252 RepID=UPI0022DF577A|nr:type IV secretory system conjugative DNA transfer family protein [Paenibacillus macerans]
MIQWGGSDLFTHMLVVGPTRCGKTATLLKPMIYQLLLLKKKGVPLGISVVEPKGDVAAMVNEMCGEMDMPCVYVDPTITNSARFPVMKGDEDDVAEATVTVLKSMFGKQEPFFAIVQELAGRNITKLLKRLYLDDVNLGDVLRTMRDQQLLEDKVRELRFKEGESDLVQFFTSELLGAQKEKYQQFVLGLRAQLENLTSNRHLEPILTGQSDFDIDRHFAEGGILAVNTVMGKLRRAGDAFGQFVVMHLQSGTFRRPGTEATRIPHFMIVDEYSRYINPDVELFLSIAAEYKTAGIFAIQSLGQLEVESGKISAKAMKQSIMTSCRNKITFGGLSYQDAFEFSREFGKKQIISRQSTFKQQLLLPNFLPENYRDTEKEEDRIFYTQLMDGLPKFHYVAKLLEDGTPLPPKIGKGTFISRDWKERREWETKRMWWNGFKSRFERNDHHPDEQEAEVPEDEIPTLSRLTFISEAKTAPKAEEPTMNTTGPIENEKSPLFEEDPFE